MKCYIIGDPVSHSFSPHLHNKVYEHLGIADTYMYDAKRVAPDQLEAAVDDMKSSDVRGVSITVPHKIEVMQYLDIIDPLAKRIGAVNTIVNEDGVLHGYNTDAEGVLVPILKRTDTDDLSGKQALIIGAGGAARAAAVTLADAKASVTVTNRTASKAEELSDLVGGSTADYDVLDESLHNYDIIFNATSVGMGEPGNTDTPLKSARFHTGQIVFDAVYAPHDTQLLKDALSAGATTIHGLEMLGVQAIGQIQRFTGHDVELETVMDILKEKLS